jgi:protoporphyrinogen oxidase
MIHDQNTESGENHNMKTAIIIGAGPAGLTTAYQLLKDTDILPIILEASEEIGGISRTAVHHGNRMDIGGHRFFSKNDAVVNLWKEMMPVQGAPSRDDKLLGRKKSLAPNGPDPEKTDDVLLVRNRVSRIFYLRKFFDYPISLKAQTFINMGFVRTMKAGFGYLSAVVFKREEKSLEDFYINRFGKALYEMFFEDYTEKLWGVHPSQIAPDWGAQRVKGLSLSKAVLAVLAKPFQGKDSKKVETSLIEEFIYPKKGPGQLWEKMAEEVVKMGGIINFDAEVIGVTTADGKIQSVNVRHHNGDCTTYSGDYFVSSMPIKDLVNSMGSVVPGPVRQIASELPYRDFITVGLLLKKLRINNQTTMKTVNNIVPDCWIYVQERDVKIGRLQIFNNWSPYMVYDLEHTVWIGLEYFCSEGDALWESTDEDYIQLAIDELVKIEIIDRADVLDSVRIKVKKAYPAYFGAYSEFGEVRKFLDHFANLYCIGRNGQHRYNNMDHSMLTGMEAVKNMMNHSSGKDNIWNVNAEEEYHETKRT